MVKARSETGLAKTFGLKSLTGNMWLTLNRGFTGLVQSDY
jgi:hypothetical protein